ncbi:MAG: flavodoxin family protein [Desulfohalobiaceae bacterium]
MTLQPDRPVIFSCSPRPGGNSDTAADLLARGVAQKGAAARVVHLRDYAVEPCIGCYRCRSNPTGRCFQEESDQSRPLFAHLLEAPLVMFCSPIFFYHLPAHFKAFIDRGQSYYVRRERGDTAILDLPHRRAQVVLQAGRPAGEQLFSGSLLTLRYFLKLFNIGLTEPLLFRGKDGPNDLKSDEQAVARIVERAAELAAGLG